MNEVPQRTRDAVHEAGHAVIALALGCTVDSIVIDRDPEIDGHRGLTTTDSGDRGEGLSQDAQDDRLAQLYLAGFAAESLVMGADWYAAHFQSTWGSGRALYPDYVAVDEIAVRRKAADPCFVLSDWLKRMVHETFAIVNRETVAILQIAGLLLERGRIVSSDLEPITLSERSD